jgi:excisionase family DNA binding protein
MVTREERTYLTAMEAAKYLGVARATFYRRYKQSLQQYKIGKLRRAYYSLSQLKELSVIEPVVVAR